MNARTSEKSSLPKKVAVLGAGGFVGKNLIAHIGSETEVTPISTKDVDLTQSNAAERLGELVVPGSALVFASAITPDKGRDLAAMMKNIQMGYQVALFAEKAALSHLVYISSDAVYSDGINPVSEISPCDPSTLYGMGHRVREMTLATAAANAKTPFACLRPCAIYGSEDAHNSYGPNRFFRAALSGKPIALFGEGEERRDHILIDDFSRMLRLVLCEKSVGTFNVVTGTALSFYEVAQTVQEIAGKGTKIECSARQGPITHRHFDNTKLIKAFPNFTFKSLADGLSGFLQK